MSDFVNQTASFDEAIKTLDNLRLAAKDGDEEAQRLLALESSPAFAFADLRKYRPKRETGFRS